MPDSDGLHGENQAHGACADSAEAAARWWTEQAGGPTWHDNGDRSEFGFLGGALAGILADKQRPTADALGALPGILAARIRAEQERLSDHPAMPVIVGTDYGPDRLLGEAADEAGVAASQFPWKTNTWVYRDRFVVSAGYGAREALVWADPSYVVPPCHRQAWDEQAMRSLPGMCGLDRYHEGPCDASLPSPLCADCGEPESYFWHGPDGYSRRHTFRSDASEPLSDNGGPNAGGPT